jgi:hypothetical protein
VLLLSCTTTPYTRFPLGKCLPDNDNSSPGCVRACSDGGVPKHTPRSWSPG